ncbi:hypothetical protein [Pelagibacterium lentulum]|uniref:Uncharacterized protein n=1 Tax=Pelagibacterium lentulum TaxID=2029865 RepID=A0A916VWB6_9HYPH|nr:hypothetical protein [Pelagibacterium lentulum]GGA45920.1 hypothetical protein GCM10011499_14580 [Pelagibacterium lentulum]
MSATALSDSGNDRIKPGGNMTPFDAVVLEIEELYEQIAGITAIENEAQHEAATKLYDDLHEAGKKADELRKEEVKPLDEAKKAAQKRFHPLIGDTKTEGKGKVPLGKEVLGQVLTPYRDKVAAEKRARAEQAAREAKEERAKAVAAMQESSGDLEAREEAERQLELAKEAEAFAKRQHKRANTGNGLRTYWIAEMVDQRKAVATMWKQNPQAFLDLAQELADKAARSGVRELDGFKITETKKAI